MSRKPATLPKGIRQRGESFLVDVTYKGVRKTATCATLEEAKAKRAELEAELRRSAGEAKASPGARVWTLGEAVERTFRDVWERNCTESTLAGYRRNEKPIVAYWGADRRLDTISTDDMDEWVASLARKGNSPATINRKLAFLSKVMSHAKQGSRGGLKEKPHLPRQREGKGRIRFLTAKEENRMIDTLSLWGRDDELECYIVLLDTGMRVSELQRLHGRDVQQDGGEMLLTVWWAKNGDSRTVPATERVATIIRRRMLEFGKGKLFPTSYATLRHTWDRMREVIGLGEDEQFTIHALRHTCASRLVQRRVPLRTVQHWMGHKTIQITVRYAHLCADNLQEARKALEMAA